MADNQVQLDFSKAQPIAAPAPQTATPSSPSVSLDFTQAQHLDQQPAQQTSPQPTPDSSTWEWLKDKLSAVFNPNDERNLHPKEVTAGAINRGANFDPATQSIYDPAKHSAEVSGAEKGLTETLSGTSQLAGKAADKLGLRHKNGQSKGIFGEAPASDVETKPEGFGEHVGYIGENLMEYVMGDEAIKSLSLAQKLGLATRIAKVAESHPIAAKLISAGLRATRAGTVGAGQEAAHGGDSTDVAIAGGSGFLSSAASEGLGAIARLAKPGVKEIAGDAVETAPRWKGASTVEKLAEANQEPAQKVVSNVARESADNVMQKFGKSAPETISSFGDAAEAVKSAAQPVFKTLDTASNGQFAVARNEMSNAAKFMKRAASSSDFAEAEKSYNTASGKIDQIITDSKGAVTPEQYQDAKNAWRSAKTMEKLHLKIDEAYSAPQKAENIAGVDRTLDLSKLQGRLSAAFKTIPEPDLQSVLGSSGTKNLFDLAKLGADPARAKTLGEIASQIGHHISAGGAGALAGLALGHALPAGALALGAHALYTNPEAGSLVVRLLQKGTSPKLIVPVVVKLLDSQREQSQGNE
jgi:hypothetical protein